MRFENRFPGTTGGTVLVSGRMNDYDVTYRVYSDYTVYVEGSGTLGFNLRDFRCETCRDDIRFHVIVDGCFTRVAAYAFFDWISLESVILPPTIETIGESAFSDCDRLRYIKLPGTIREIGSLAFLYTEPEEVGFYDELPVGAYAEQYFRAKKIRMKHRGRIL